MDRIVMKTWSEGLLSRGPRFNPRLLQHFIQIFNFQSVVEFQFSYTKSFSDLQKWAWCEKSGDFSQHLFVSVKP